ncbi:MAG: phospholipid/cholesterol/gamma-HCH transport system substrate-binding protein [Pseudonocardiales bacterium]|jgi:virulence factor Mce-like protein|nr:phospholipid/cholesterol/gamma-HCH transport system substrate-binding protein [Pseudonocardiales bacterium]
MPRWIGRLIAIGCVLAILVTASLVAAGVWWLAPRSGRTITAYLTSAVGVFPDNAVLVLGVPVGRITSVQPQGRLVKITMRVDGSVDVPAGASAVVISPSLVAGRSIQLTPAYTRGPRMPDGGVIPVERTAVPLGIDDLTRAANDLATMLGPTGVNRPGPQENGAQGKGALSDLLDVGAANLRGNGQAINDTIGNVTALSATLAGSRKELFATVTQLQSFVSTLAVNDAQVRQFTSQLADVSNFLAGERGDLGAALRELSIALGEVAAFVQDNRAVLRSNVDRLTEVTAVLVRQREALGQIIDIAPTALSNLNNAYNASSGTLDTRLNIEELRAPPILLVCELLRRSTPRQVPATLAQTCRALEPQLTGAVPLPTAAQVITALQAGQPPPLPLLALPSVPGNPEPGGRR